MVQDNFKHKNTKQIPELTNQDAVRFWDKVNYSMDIKRCWEWQACVEKNGYGVFGKGRSEPFKAHRIAYTLANGAIPKGMIVCHSCDNRKCVNPSHFFVGTESDRDKVSKGRANNPTGDNHWAVRNPHLVKKGDTSGTSKLSSALIIEIRSAKKEGNIGKCEFYNLLAIKYNISERQIRRVLNNQAWNHL